MPVQVPPGFAQASVEMRHSGYSRAAYNVWGWEGVGEYPTPEAAANAFMDGYGVAFAQLLDSQVSIYSVRLEIGQDGGEPIIGFSNAPPFPGTRSSASVSPALAVRGIKRTNLGGRRNRGSFFLPWATSQASVSEGGQIQTATLTTIQDRMTAFVEQWTTTDQGLYILHGTGASELPEPTQITGLQADPVISNQVRRQTKRG